MHNISSKTLRILALSRLRGVGPVALKKASSFFAFERLSIGEIAAAIPAVAKATIDRGAWIEAQDGAANQAVQAEKIGARIISPADDEYPPLLSSTRDDPSLLFVKGCLTSRTKRAVAIIGTREPTEHGAIVATRMAAFFSEQGWSVVSGLALGCDAIAHQATIDAGGHTVAVLAHGLHMVAPARHRRLAEDILSKGGALVSEFPVGQNALPQQFVKRDRTQAGLAEGVVMVQSDLKGGSLHASRASLDYGRWLAIPYPTTRDFENMEPKIQANLVLTDGSDSEKTDLLRCNNEALANVIPIRNKGDYAVLLNQLQATEAIIPEQRSLL